MRTERVHIVGVYMCVYTFSMSNRAKLFKNGGSQAVRLPKDCRFPDGQDEVVVRKEGRSVILTPVDEWSVEFARCIGAWSGDIPRPRHESATDDRDPFA